MESEILLKYALKGTLALPKGHIRLRSMIINMLLLVKLETNTIPKRML